MLNEAINTSMAVCCTRRRILNADSLLVGAAGNFWAGRAGTEAMSNWMLDLFSAMFCIISILYVAYIVSESTFASHRRFTKQNNYGIASGSLRMPTSDVPAGEQDSTRARRSLRRLPDHFPGVLVIPQTKEHRLAQMYVAGPFRETNLSNQPRLKPRAEFHPGCGYSQTAVAGASGWQICKRTIGTLQFFEFLIQRLQKRPVKSGADFRGKHQFITLIISNKDGANIGARSFGLGVSSDDKFLLVAPFKLHPRAAAPAWLIFPIAPFGDQAFQSARLHCLDDAFGIRLDAGGQPDGFRYRRHQILEHFFSLLQRQSRQVVTVEIWQIEYIIENRRLFAAGHVVSLQ